MLDLSTDISKREFMNDFDEVSKIRKFANLSILLIWIAGILSLFVFTFYLLGLPINANNDHAEINYHVGSNAAFPLNDKTVLVNIGLKARSIPLNADEKSLGNIRVNKMLHDLRIKRSEKAIKTDFSIKAVPK